MEKRGEKYHRERLGEALREEIDTLVEGELEDPRIGLVAVTSVVLAEDSRSAQVYVTLDGDDEEAERPMEGLTAAVGFIRREVAENLHLRRPPELYFHLDRSDQYGARAIDAGVLPFETVENEARAAGAAHFAALKADAQAAADAWRALAAALDARAGDDTPPTSRVRELLERVVAAVGRFAPDDAEATVADVAAPSPGGAPALAVAGGGIGITGAVASREEALRSLAAIADFFRRTEPLSPLSYTLQEAVRRSRMSWPELLEEIVPDAGQRSQILLSLGIRPPPSE